MIGVHTNSADPRFVAELFELFKTPWEPAVPGRRYRAIITNEPAVGGLDADVCLVFSASETPQATPKTDQVRDSDRPILISWRGAIVPIYGSLVTFGSALGTSVVTNDGLAVDSRNGSTGRTVWRVGFDLFAEVQWLLTRGQPADQAHVPTLDLHVELLRSLLLESGVSLLEIPPRPFGYDFTCCLTHDVDFFGIARHKGDRTLAGFLLRASIGGVVDLVRGRRSAADVLRNLRAALSLPLIFLGMARDFWQPFEDYLQVEDARRSTFFLVPFPNRSGRAPGGQTEPMRAVKYQIRDIRDQAREALHRGSELAVHGIDAWCDVTAGRAELAELTAITAVSTAGVRMHWLYFAADSPERLEAAGFDYDSTWGFNDVVGYRAGTSQVFRLADTERLMELPLTIMDSAMFSSRRMALRPAEAASLYEPIVDHAKRTGGTVVINWHDRSLAPERLWDRPYRDLLSYVARNNQVWFTTAGKAVDWFRWRRAVRFQRDGRDVLISAPEAGVPEGMLRISRVTAHGIETDDLKLSAGATSVRVGTFIPQRMSSSIVVN